MKADRADPDTDLDDIFRATHSRLVTSMYALTGNVAEAQDVVAEAFVRAVSYRRTVLAAANPEAWLFTVARNIARSRWRRATRLPVLLRRTAGDGQVPEISPDRVALVTAIRRLPVAQRETIVLHYLVDMPVSEIALALGISVGTVKSRLSRGRTALADALAEAEDPADSPEAGLTAC